MKKYLTILLGLSLSAAAWADPQIDMDNDNTCHFPLAHFSPGWELNLDTSQCQAGIAELHGQAAGYCDCKLKNVPEEVLEHVFWTVQKITADGLVRILKVDSDQAYYACNMDVDGGNDYRSNNWRARIKYNEEKGVIRAKLLCLDGRRI